MGKQQESPEKIVLTSEQAAALQTRLAAVTELNASDIKILVGLIDFSLWLQKQLSLASLSIRRLKKLFGFSTEKKTAK